MKMMPTKDLIAILNKSAGEIVGEGYIEKVFTMFGDDYFKDHGECDWELCRENEYREGYLNDKRTEESGF